MFRWLINCCLIVVLLWCPLRCQAMAANACAEEPASATKCRCCKPVCPSAVEEDSVRQNAPVHSEDCTCGNCLCEGAVVRNVDEIEAPTATLHAACLEPAAGAVLDSSPLSMSSTEPPTQIFSSGREIAVLYGNLRR